MQVLCIPHRGTGKQDIALPYDGRLVLEDLGVHECAVHQYLPLHLPSSNVARQDFELHRVSIN